MRQCLLDEIIHYISPYNITVKRGRSKPVVRRELRKCPFPKASPFILILSIYHTKDINSLRNLEGSCGASASSRFSSTWEVKGARVNGLMTPG